ncbi:phosphotransferase [Mumia qirimensis]|uniref:phosphotransferase n=1 Tax=Mumia qirimensis TaxID=3234852 RepID=UPI00351DA003
MTSAPQHDRPGSYDREVSEIPNPSTVAVPAIVERLADGAGITPVWRNELGGVTFRLGTERFVKWMPHGSEEIDLVAEAARMRWASHWIRVPDVLGLGSDQEATWLITAALPGLSAVSPTWIDAPEIAARAIGAGLRHLHEALPVAECPYDWGVAARLARTPNAYPDELRTPPPVDRLVVCHGDACAPNTLLDEHGQFVAHVDLGSLGTADRWADLAVAAWSMDWNFGPGYDDLVYAAYGVEPDAERIAYYRLLWDHA